MILLEHHGLWLVNSNFIREISAWIRRHDQHILLDPSRIHIWRLVIVELSKCCGLEIMLLGQLLDHRRLFRLLQKVGIRLLVVWWRDLVLVTYGPFLRLEVVQLDNWLLAQYLTLDICSARMITKNIWIVGASGIIRVLASASDWGLILHIIEVKPTTFDRFIITIVASINHI